MNGLFQVALELQTFCDRQDWRSCFIGGLAVQRWGEPRVTRDVDLTLVTGFGGEVPFVDALLKAYPARIGNAREFALSRRILLLQTPNGVGIDISLGALPFEECMVARATPFAFTSGCDVRTCSAEDLVILKLFASRPIDIQDAEGVVCRHHDRLDWEYIEQQLVPLSEAREQPEILATLARLRK